jgi:hypothetical protein
VKRGSLCFSCGQNGLGLQPSCFKPLLKERLGLSLALLLGLGHYPSGLFANCLEINFGLLSGCLKLALQNCFLVMDSL